MSSSNMSIISPSVQKTLFEKISMMERTSGLSQYGTNYGGKSEVMHYRVGDPTTDGEFGTQPNYMNARSTWMRMVSMKRAPDGSFVILQGGESDSKGNYVGNMWGQKNKIADDVLESKVGEHIHPHQKQPKPSETVHGRYWVDGENQPFRPTPGIKDLRVEHRTMSGTATAPTRTTEINWVCWTWQDLDRLTKHFLSPTLSVFVDWGWTGPGGSILNTVEPYPLFQTDDDGNLTGWKDQVDAITNKLSQYIVDQNGHYDAIIGQVYNFEWKVRDDGGFDCLTQIIGKGSHVLSKMNTIGADKIYDQLPNMIQGEEKIKYEKNYSKFEVGGFVGEDSYETIRESEDIQRTWILPIFSAEKFFKPESDVWNQISHQKLRGIALSTDPDGGKYIPGEVEVVTDTSTPHESGNKYMPDSTEFHSETAGGLPISDDDEKLKEKDISMIDMSTAKEFERGGAGWDELKRKEVDSRKFLWLESNQLLTALSPWITFDDYLDDIWNQVFNLMRTNDKFIKSGNVIGIFGDGIPGFSQSSHLYVTWGWFEDNVISRFFGELNRDSDLSISFRSFEDRAISDSDKTKRGSDLKQFSQRGNNILYDTDGNGKPDLAMDPSGNYYKCNSKGVAYGDIVDPPESSGGGLTSTGRIPCMTPAGEYVFTTDTSKFLLIDENSMTLKWVSKWWGEGWGSVSQSAPSLDVYTNDKINEVVGYTEFQAPPIDINECVDEELEKVFRGETVESTTQKYFKDLDTKNKDGIIRNVYFNVQYLKHVMADAGTIGAAIKRVWDGFSEEYGNIFSMDLKFNNTEDRLMVTSNTFVESSVSSLLDNKSHRMDPLAEDGSPNSEDKFDGLLEFPSWERGSIVKSQNLSSNLPTALKNKLSHQVHNVNPEDDEKTYDAEDQELKAMAKLIKPEVSNPGPIGTGNQESTEEQSAEAQFANDIFVGNFDFPYRNNRWFGLNSANINEDLEVGKEGMGSKLGESILKNLVKNEAHKRYNQRRNLVQGESSGENAIIGNTEETDKALEERDKMIAEFQIQADNASLGPEEGSSFYEMLNMDYGNSVSQYHPNGDYYKLNQDMRSVHNALLRGEDGPVGKQDILIPIDFDMDIDGTGGIFPGNAFASSYLPTRYRRLSCFQAVGVEHRVDPSGWTTTVKGQFRVAADSDSRQKTAEDPGLFVGKGTDPNAGFAKPTIPAPKLDDSWDEFLLGDLTLDELDFEDYSNLEKPPPPPEPVKIETEVEVEVDLPSDGDLTEAEANQELFDIYQGGLSQETAQEAFDLFVGDGLDQETAQEVFDVFQGGLSQDSAQTLAGIFGVGSQMNYQEFADMMAEDQNAAIMALWELPEYLQDKYLRVWRENDDPLLNDDGESGPWWKFWGN